MYKGKKKNILIFSFTKNLSRYCAILPPEPEKYRLYAKTGANTRAPVQNAATKLGPAGVELGKRSEMLGVSGRSTLPPQSAKLLLLALVEHGCCLKMKTKNLKDRMDSVFYFTESRKKILPHQRKPICLCRLIFMSKLFLLV